jgi:hypothetical protein
MLSTRVQKHHYRLVARFDQGGKRVLTVNAGAASG